MPSIAHVPTALEQLLLETVNRARANPAGEFDALIADAATGSAVQSNISAAIAWFGVDLDAYRAQLSGLAAVAPLAWNGELAYAAELHSLQMIDADTQSHRLPGEDDLGTRITAAGYDWASLRENVYAYVEDMVYAHAGFFIDWGFDASDWLSGVLIPNWRTNGDGMQDALGHRVAILDATMTEIGIGVLAEDDPATEVGPHVVTQDFGTRFGYAPQLLGVVIDDGDGDDFYDIGEGLGGVTVTATGGAGTFATQSWASGGYQMELPAGSYTVTFSGAGLVRPWSYSVTIGTDNVKLDLNTDDIPPLPKDQTGTEAADRLDGDGRNNLLSGLGGNDTLYGGDGADTLNGGTGDDFIFGGATAADLRDVVYGGDGNDSIDGGHGNDELHGGNGNDTILGGFGADTLIGNDGRDNLAGGAGADMLYGGPGNDILNGGFGFDRLNGGTGADRFYHQGLADHGTDWVQDYSAAQGDLLQVGLAGATRAQFQVNIVTVPGNGQAGIAEALVIYRPTGQVLWTLVDGAAQTDINLLIGGTVYDLMA